MKWYHKDHGLEAAHIELAEAHAASATGFFIATLELHSDVAPLSCGLHGPAMGDDPILDGEIEMVQRSADRPLSRLCGRAPRPSRKMTVIGIGAGADSQIFTAYGGPAAPREPGDPDLTEAEAVASASFWSLHALSRA